MKYSLQVKFKNALEILIIYNQNAKIINQFCERKKERRKNVRKS